MITSDHASELTILAGFLGQGFRADALVLALSRRRSGLPVSDSGRTALRWLGSLCDGLLEGKIEPISVSQPRGLSYARDVENIVAFASTRSAAANAPPWESVRELIRRMAAATNAMADGREVDQGEVDLLESFCRMMAKLSLEATGDVIASSAVRDTRDLFGQPQC